ncbi:DUF4918 family protein [Oceanispirochaeta sp. M1]|nr:DUF4918 family protein [Oceanispirochaeta sp. M1]
MVQMGMSPDKNTFASSYLSFITSTGIPLPLPDNTDLLYPYEGDEVRRVMGLYFNKYYGDKSKRIFLIGINPGRLGCGVTGINFTDADSLRDDCGIDCDFKGGRELSSRFIYEMINFMGGSELFFSRYFLTALSPLGFTCEGKNRNYYDTPALMAHLKPWLVESFKRQIEMGAERRIAFSLGKGKNFKILKELNAEHCFFEEILPLPHPRWVLQYKLKEKETFLNMYDHELNKAYRRCKDGC